MALFSTIFIVFFSTIIMQNLSASSVQVDENPEITPMPTPTNADIDIVPNDDASIIDNNFYMTKNQKYFESIVSSDSTNILLLGTEPTGFNFDTIIVLNIDRISQKVKVINFPRDIYIDYSNEILDAVGKVKPYLLNEKGINRINAAPSIGDTINYQKNTGRFNKPYVDFIADLLDEVFGIHIEDYAYVKTKGFRNIIDSFGGVSVYVPVLMDYTDPTQDFSVYIEKGTQHLDGAQAEGFVRFRQGYDENGVFHNYGDIFRKENQSKFIQAFINQHLTLKNLGKLNTIANIISSNVITSVKGWDNIVEYGALAEEALSNKYPIESVKLELSEKNIDGSSYVIIKTEMDKSATGE